MNKVGKYDFSQVPRVWENPVNCPDFEEYERIIKSWAEQYPRIVSLESRNKNSLGDNIWLIKITDNEVSDENKQVTLFSALHSGIERNATTSMLHIIKWLLSDEPLAVETRKKQIVLFMPVCNPYGYRNLCVTTPETICCYAARDWKNGGKSVDDFMAVPEIAAYCSVIDEYQPEINADMHGITLEYDGQTITEITGLSYSNASLRPWEQKIVTEMDSAGNRAGYAYDKAESDAQRMLYGAGLERMLSKLWPGRGNYYTAMYAYEKSHTMLLASEIGWEESAKVRHQRLLEIGNNTWPGEFSPGYPVNTISAFESNFICAWGNTASQKRRSRVELWELQEQFTLGMIYPKTEGRTLFVFGANAEASQLISEDLNVFIANMYTVEGVNAEYLEAFVKFGPEKKLCINSAEKSGYRRINNGFAIRIRLDYPNLQRMDIRLNGQPLTLNAANGYLTGKADGWTWFQINIPPAMISCRQLFVVTCAYDPNVIRPHGFVI